MPIRPLTLTKASLEHDGIVLGDLLVQITGMGASGHLRAVDRNKDVILELDVTEQTPLSRQSWRLETSDGTYLLKRGGGCGCGK